MFRLPMRDIDAKGHYTELREPVPARFSISPMSVHVVRNKTWYEAYAMRHNAKPRTQKLNDSLPAVRQWDQIQGMSLSQLAEKCKRSTFEQHLVIGMRDVDHAALHLWGPMLRCSM